MIETQSSRTLTVTIACSAEEVYAFVANPLNLPAWATGFCRGVAQGADGWVADTQDGPVGIRFVDPNSFGVLDHHVRLASGEEIFIPMRVVPNGTGSELLFTLFRLPGVSEEKFARDVALIERDLFALTDLLRSASTDGGATNTHRTTG